MTAYGSLDPILYKQENLIGVGELLAVPLNPDFCILLLDGGHDPD
jgi:hypothetical protein